MSLRRATLYVKIDGRLVEVAPCTIDMTADRDGHGVFTTREGDREPGRILDHFRIASLSPEAVHG